jgi:LacI family transcriptional regulator
MAATIGDVAERAHVSTATVSRVLAGVGRARPETEARVLAAARELDYRPSGVARSLKRQTTETLGLIVTDIENPYFPELVRAVEDAARAEGYAILLCNAADDPEREAGYLDLLVERRVDGLIIAASSLGGRHAEWLAAAPLPVVLVNTAAADVDLPSIHSDNRAGSRLAAEHLLDLGHRRFGYLMPPPRNVDGAVRLAGVQDALADAGLDPASIAIATGAPLVGGGEAAMLELLDRAPDVTAVLAYNDLMAIGALRAVRRRGGSVPGHVSVVGFDDVALAAYVDPPLTTLSQSTAEMGYWAVARLAERLRPRSGIDDAGNAPRGGAGSAPSVMLPVRLEVRGSTGPPRAG